MSNGIYIATAGAIAQSNAMDATANNIANAATAGFQGDHITFREQLGRAKSTDVAMVDAGTTRADNEHGALSQTNNPLDVALEGDGFIGVDAPNGVRYTRAGNLTLDGNRTLTTADGLAVRAQGGGTITVPPTASQIAITPEGDVSADGASVGKIELASFDPAQVKREGGSLFSATGEPLAGQAPKLRSGMLESSNVNIIRGVVDLVKVSRTYESLMKVIQGFSDTEQKAATDLGAPK